MLLACDMHSAELPSLVLLQIVLRTSGLHDGGHKISWCSCNVCWQQLEPACLVFSAAT